jgi:uncharacterized protein YceK
MKKVLFLLAISVFLGGCSLVVSPKSGITPDQLSAITQKNQDLQSQVAELQENNKSLQAVNDKYSSILPGNFAYKGTFCYFLEKFKKFSEVFPEFKLDTIEASLRADLEKGEIYQVCDTSYKSRAFLMYGDFGKENNLIGLIMEDAATSELTLVTGKQYNQSSGDLGVCSIDGAIEQSNIIYSCGGGDGPGGWDRVYILNPKTGSSQLIKDCESLDGKVTCKYNPLKLEFYY